MNRSLLLFPLILMLACGDDAPPPPVGDSGANRRDQGNNEDTGTPDIGSGDTDIEIDTGPADAGDSEVPCTAEVFELARDPIFRNRPVSATATGRGFYFGWGDSQDVREQARTAELAQGAVEPMVQALTNDDNSARLVTVADGFAIWLDDGGSGENLVIRGMQTQSRSAEPRVLSSTSGQHQNPWLISMGDSWLAGWTRQEGEQWQIQTRIFGADSEQSIQTLPWNVPTGAVAIDFAEEQFYAVWVDDGSVMLAIANAAGEEVSAPQVVSDSTDGVDGELDVAFANGFGVVSFALQLGPRKELRARLYAASGDPVRSERVVSRAPMQGRAPAVTAYAGGYAIAFRARDRESEFLQVAFVHGSEGSIVAEYRLGDSLFEGARPGVAVDDAGGLGVGWAGDEDLPDARVTVIQGSRLSCGAAWLRCGVAP